MIYEYRCAKCLHNFDVVKPVSEVHLTHDCEACGHHETHRVFSSNIHITGAKVEDAEFNPGLGCVVKGKNHRKEIAARKGLIEVGSESADTLFKETVVKKEEQKAREWKEL